MIDPIKGLTHVDIMPKLIRHKTMCKYPANKIPKIIIAGWE